MPTYDYRCEANDQIIEVHHRISEKMKTWGELCDMAGIEPGDIPLDTAVTRLVTGGNFNKMSPPIKLNSILPK